MTRYMMMTYNQGDSSGLFIHHYVTILQIVVTECDILAAAFRHRRLQYINLVFDHIELELLCIFRSA